MPVPYGVGPYTYELFRHDVAVLTRRRRDGQRAGQVAYNALADSKHDLAMAINGTENDPYYLDERLPEFFRFVEEHWDAEIERRF